jgi:ABC-type sugar transport system ATPase subunit
MPVYGNDGIVVIEFERVTKRFPGVAALSDVSFSIASGACHALLGENGAGKSTLGKLLAGLYSPDGGEIRVAGRPLRQFTPRAALAAGIALVHQELALCPNLSVAENLGLHALPSRGLRLNRSALRSTARALLEPVGLEVDVDLPAGRLSPGDEQRLQIAAALGLNARVLVFDEPTSSLGKAETERLFAILRRLKSEGRTVIYVSHRLDEIFALCDAVTVLRDGRHVSTTPLEGLTEDDLITRMVGRSVTSTRVATVPSDVAAEVLQLQGVVNQPGGPEVKLSVRSGEVVGLAGLVGAGRTELLETVAGLRPVIAGQMTLGGRPYRPTCPAEALAAGVALIPEDRKRAGLVLGLSVADNLTLPFLKRFRGALGRLVRSRRATHCAQEISRLRIKTATAEVAAGTLSGGNQQKIVFSKGLELGRTLLLVDEPTRGVDVGAKQELHELIHARAAEGGAVLVASSELPELMSLAQRILVVRGGRIVAEHLRADFNAESILRDMAGVGALERR